MNPQHQSVLILPKTYLDLKLGECSRFIESNLLDEKNRTVGFSEYERVKFSRLREYALTAKVPNKEVLMSDFFLFFREHDRRRGTNLMKTFPEFAGFWESCRQQAEQQTAGRKPGAEAQPI